MKGKKLCSNCNTVLAARSSQCTCGFKFYDKKLAVEKKEPVQAAGKGRKQCPKCSKFNGVRTHICECGHDFTIAPCVAPKFNGPIKLYANYDKEPIQPAYAQEVYGFVPETIKGVNIGSPVLVPAGICPHVIKDYTEEGITKWAKSVFDAYYNSKQKASLTAQALSYFAKQSTKNDEDKQTLVNKVLFQNLTQQFRA